MTNGNPSGRSGEGHRSGDEVVAFAHAVQGPGRRDGKVLLLKEDNVAGSWVPLWVAVRDDRAFLTRCRGDLLPGDVDGADAPRVARTLRNELLDAGLRPVEWASGTPGHRQLLVGMPSNRDRRLWKERFESMGVEVKKFVRPPLSPHRKGLPVSLVFPESVPQALDALNGTVVHQDDKRRLTSRTYSRLRYGDPEIADQSRLIFRIAMGACATGWSALHTFNALVLEENLGGHGLRRRIDERGERHGHRWFFDYVWPDVQAQVVRNPPITDPTLARVTIYRLRCEMDECQWLDMPVTLPGGTEATVRGASVYKLVAGACDIADLAGRVSLYISERQFAESAGIGSRFTVRKAILAAMKMGWLQRLRVGKGRSASEWRLAAPSEAEGTGPQEHTPKVCT